MECTPSEGHAVVLWLMSLAACLQEIATEDLKRLAGVIAEEAGYFLGFYAASVIDKPSTGDEQAA